MPTTTDRGRLTLAAVYVRGFRALAECRVEFRPLNVIIGPNATGKSSLIDLASLCSEAADAPISQPIADRGGLSSVLWGGGANSFMAALSFHSHRDPPAFFTIHTLEVQAEGYAPVVAKEQLGQGTRVQKADEETGLQEGDSVDFVRFYGRRGTTAKLRLGQGSLVEYEGELDPGELLLSSLRDPQAYPEQNRIREYLEAWRFYLGFDVSSQAPMRRPYQLGSSETRDQYLAPNGSNLAGMVSVLRASTSYRDEFQQVEEWCSLAFPEFESLGSERGISGTEVRLEWREYDRPSLTAAQLSDGLLRFLCLAVLAASPHPPPLVCIDEPELGLHPKLLPLVAAMLRTLSERTQVIIITHSPQFLNSFPLDSIIVSSKDEDGCHFHKPADNEQLKKLLEPTIGETIGTLYETGELEFPPDEPAEAAVESE